MASAADGRVRICVIYVFTAVASNLADAEPGDTTGWTGRTASRGTVHELPGMLTCIIGIPEGCCAYRGAGVCLDHVERVGVRRQPIGVTCYAVINPGEAAPISIRVLVTRKARNCQNLWITSAGLPVSPMQVTAGGSADAPCSSRGEQSETTGEAAGSAALRRNQSDALATSS